MNNFTIEIDVKKECYANGNIKEKTYIKNGMAHNPNGPAQIYYNINGTIEAEKYYIDGIEHRENGPASIYYYRKDSVLCEVYMQNGLRHRLDGPTVIDYDENGNITNEQFYIKGKCYTKENYYKENRENIEKTYYIKLKDACVKDVYGCDEEQSDHSVIDLFMTTHTPSAGFEIKSKKTVNEVYTDFIKGNPELTGKIEYITEVNKIKIVN